MHPAHSHLAGVLAVFLATGVAVAAAIALAGDARRATVIAAAVAALAGVVLGWALRSHLRPSGALLYATGGGCSWLWCWAVF